MVFDILKFFQAKKKKDFQINITTRVLKISKPITAFINFDKNF